MFTKSKIIVLLLSGVGLAIVLWGFLEPTGFCGGGSQDLAAQMFVQESLRSPLATFRQHMGRYPSTEEGLKALIQPPVVEAASWRGPYLVDGTRLPLDPWGRPYQYAFPGRGPARPYDIWSLGPDPANAADDIGNW